MKMGTGKYYNMIRGWEMKNKNRERLTFPKIQNKN